MTSTFTQIIQPKIAESALTTQYTAINCSTNILKFTATNFSGANKTISVHIVPLGGTPDNSNLYVSAQPVAPGKTYKFPEIVGHGLAPGWFISTIASDPNAFRIAATGDEIT